MHYEPERTKRKVYADRVWASRISTTAWGETSQPSRARGYNQDVLLSGQGIVRGCAAVARLFSVRTWYVLRDIPFGVSQQYYT